jgi:hypothetical protein
MKKAIVNILNCEQSESYLINESDIEESVTLHDMTVFDIDDCSEKFTPELLAMIQSDLDLEVFEWYDLDSYLDKYHDISIDQLNSIEVCRSCKVLTCREGTVEVEDLADWNTDYTFNYWDGSNWRFRYIESNYDTFEDDDCDWKTLDEWNGNNFQFHNTGLHCKICKHPDLSDMYMIHEYSQYQDYLDTLHVVTLQELEKFLKETDREEYIKEVI